MKDVTKGKKKKKAEKWI